MTPRKPAFWSMHNDPPQLRANDVHLWRIELDAVQDLDRLWQTLSVDEQERARRLRYAQHRSRFVAGRGVLRAILARYTGLGAEQLQFRYTEQGKPLLGGTAPDWLQFNLTHSQHLALLAIARERRVGVDVEWIGEADYEQIARRFFAAAEYEALLHLPLEQRQEAFYRCWTGKEALVKALGAGLLVNLKHFVIGFAPDAALTLHWHDDPLFSRHWWLASEWPAPGFVAALAVERRASDAGELQCQRLTNHAARQKL